MLFSSILPGFPWDVLGLCVLIRHVHFGFCVRLLLTLSPDAHHATDLSTTHKTTGKEETFAAQRLW